MFPKLQLMSSPVGIGCYFQGHIGADIRDMTCPVPSFLVNIERSRKEYINRHIDHDTQKVKVVPDEYLARKVVQHILDCHNENPDLSIVARIVAENMNLDYTPEDYEECRRVSVPGKSHYLFGHKIPKSRCEILEDILD